MPRPRTPAEAAAAAAAVPGATVQPAGDTIPSYIIQPGQTPKQVEMRRRLAQSLMEQGTSTAPVQGGWIEAATRPLIAGIAGIGEYGAAEEERKGQRSAADALSQALTGQNIQPQQLANFFGNEWASPGQQSVLASIYEQQQKAAEPEKLIPVDKKIYDPNTGQWILPPGGAAGQADISDINTTVSKYDTQPGIKRWREVQPIVSSMQKSLKDPSAISDMDFVYGTATTLDPGSVVRTQEGDQIAATQAMPAWLAGQLNKIMKGEAVLDLKTRKNILELVRRRAGAMQQQAQEEYDYYTKTYGNYIPQQYFRAPGPLDSYNPDDYPDTPATPPPAPAPPQPGDLSSDGKWKFKGGNPADQNSWEPVQ